MGRKVTKCYFSYSFHFTFLKLYGSIGLHGLAMGCAQYKDSSTFGFLALLDALHQQSYCRHAGVRRPSVVRPSVIHDISESAAQIVSIF